MSWPEILAAELGAANLTITPERQHRLAVYAAEIEHWNRSINLTALRGAALIRRLIVEPIKVGRHFQMHGVLGDIGSGNGSPGLPLFIAGDFTAAHLIEPRMKRVVFLRHVIAKLGLRGVNVHRNRIEEMSTEHFGCTWITLQAIDPKPLIVDSLSGIGVLTTQVVWLTSRDTCAVESATQVEIPGCAVKVWCFRLDQI